MVSSWHFVHMYNTLWSAVPMKFQQNGHLNKTWTLTRLNDKPERMEKVSEGSTWLQVIIDSWKRGNYSSLGINTIISYLIPTGLVTKKEQKRNPINISNIKGLRSFLRYTVSPRQLSVIGNPYWSIIAICLWQYISLHKDLKVCRNIHVYTYNVEQ